jgi:hypothetical protein
VIQAFVARIEALVVRQTDSSLDASPTLIHQEAKGQSRRGFDASHYSFSEQARKYAMSGAAIQHTNSFRHTSTLMQPGGMP